MSGAGVGAAPTGNLGAAGGVSPAVVSGDEDAIERARAGDGDAYARLVARHQQVAFRAAFAVCGDAAEAEDAAQDAFMKAHVALGRFRPGAPFRPWLLRIVGNEARNRRRSAGRREHLAVRAAHEPRTPPREPDTAVLERETRGRLAEALARLDDAQRQAVLLRHVLDLSEAECAAVLGCRRGTVKSRVSRGLANLREDLGAADA